MSIEGKVALVTGATRGIGKAIALELGRRGCVVVGTATSDGGAEQISAYLAEAGVNGKGYRLDVAQPEMITEVLAAIAEEFGAPAVLVNNAGITRDNLLMRMKDDEWQSVIDTNLTSIYRLSKACMRPMSKARWGRIVNVSSVIASLGNAGQTNYAAAKAGIEGFTRALARELAARNVTVNSVAPGFIDTDMTSGLPEKHKETMIQSQIPLARMGKPEEIAAAVAFLVDESGAYITGETIHVNGGMYMA